MLGFGYIQGITAHDDHQPGKDFVLAPRVAPEAIWGETNGLAGSDTPESGRRHASNRQPFLDGVPAYNLSSVYKRRARGLLSTGNCETRLGSQMGYVSFHVTSQRETPASISASEVK